MKIKWIGPKRLIPKIGEVRADRVITVSANDGHSLIKQGLAIENRPKKLKKKEK